MTATPREPSSNAHADLIAPELLGDVMQDAWGEICDDTGCHPLDIKRMGRNVFYDGGHWTALIALRLNERLAADALQALHVTTSGWQDIATAPIEQRVLLWCVDPSFMTRQTENDAREPVFGQVFLYSDGSRKVRADGMSGDWTFTQWHPLPAPPADDKGLPDEGMSACQDCGERYPTAPEGYIHKCGKCRGYCKPIARTALTEDKGE